jgi:hypothetical protein
MAKVLCVLYDDPVGGMPKMYARDAIPHILRYPGGQTTPTPKQIDFTRGELLGCVSGELGLRKFLEFQGHSLIVTLDKYGPNSAFERELPDAEVPAPQHHPWWTMPHHGMTPHTSGTTLSAQARYAAGTREILECWFDKRGFATHTLSWMEASSLGPANTGRSVDRNDFSEAAVQLGGRHVYQVPILGKDKT